MFLLTVMRTIALNLMLKGTTMSLLQLMFRDVICAANIVTSVMFLEDLKAINATFSSLITSLMLSRLYLNLRKEGSRDTDDAKGFTHIET
ncbi:hypothetical protein CVT25_006675 [Psilocybe cyanescens]|uniref:Uncharacterized protein n=1 Tax=Psilocybe cyanescens TaxID=93625 RepID=A0A409X3X1_PSICY|nr:hypothetical protein CVT25_006675 [Psilocybe cyanescens]